MGTLVQEVSVWALPVLAAIILHEIAHGIVAYRLGDPTAARMGRLTLNPLPHVDPFGTVLLPLLLIATHAPFLFGWARPVPVNFGNLRRPKRDMVLVAMAGPLTNLLLAVISATIFKWLLRVQLQSDGALTPTLVAVLTPVALLARNSVMINVVLAVFNLMPILPLDGGRVVAGLLPARQAVAFARLERLGMKIVLVLIVTYTLAGTLINTVILVVRGESLVVVATPLLMAPFTLLSTVGHVVGRVVGPVVAAFLHVLL